MDNLNKEHLVGLRAGPVKFINTVFTYISFFPYTSERSCAIPTIRRA